MDLSGSLAAFTEPTQLHAEHRRLMEDRHRPVDFTRSTAASLPAELRAGLAAMWRARTVSEHRAIGIFHLFALDLLAAGAPVEMLSATCRAAMDEVRHAELCARLTECYSGAPETPPPGIPPLSEDPSITLSHQVVREALHLSIGSETFSAVLLSEKLDRARDPVVRDVLGVLIADEIHHARMGWAFIGALLGGEGRAAGEREALRAQVQGEIVPLFDDLTRAMFGDPRELPPPSLPEAQRELAAGHGWMAARDEYALYLDAIDGVWRPGLAALGLEVGALEGRYPRLD